MSSETVMKIRVVCPLCHGDVMKNGRARGEQRWRCRNKLCGHQFLNDPDRRRLPPEIVRIIKKLLALGVAPEVVSQAAKISKRQAYNYKKAVSNG